MASRSSNRRHLEIALAIRMGVPHLERVAQGIRQYAAKRARWRFLVNPETHDLPPVSLKGWTGDGVIALCNTLADQRALRGLKCPVINISGARGQSPFPRVRNDYREIGRRGAAFLRDRGFRRFGFYGVADLWYSKEVEFGFLELAGESSIPVKTLHAANPIEGAPRWNRGQEQLERWIRKLQPPFAIMAAHDPRAAIVIRACERMGLKVPQDVAVLGVNDDTVTCETSHPHLSSIDRNGFEVGWQAAVALDRLIRRRPVADETVVEPGPIRERESTDTLAVDRPELAAAIRFVERRFGDTIGVDQIADACGMSRRWLEEAFRQRFNITPSAFLERRRLQHAVTTLDSEPHLQLGRLAEVSGFTDSRRLNAAFRRRFGMPVKAFIAARNEWSEPGAAIWARLGPTNGGTTGTASGRTRADSRASCPRCGRHPSPCRSRRTRVIRAS